MPARVLIIDDNQSLAENLRDVITGARDLDVEVVLARDGREGIAASKQDGFDVAVVDVKLPDASGVELIRPLRAASPMGEIVLVTGFATLDTAIAALRAGAFAFILKSFRPEELLSTVAQALEKVALKREREEYMRRYRALVEAADVLIVGLDATGRVQLFNRRIAALTGVGPDVAATRPFAEQFVEESDHKRLEQAIHDVLGSSMAAEVELGVRDKMGAVRRVRWHLSGVPKAGAKADLIYGIGIDVTERRALERRAADAVALNAMAPLALGLAHEIRNPLNAAVLELHLLSRGIDRLGDEAVAAPMKRRVGIVEGEIKRLERLLSEFLELARPRAPERKPVDLARVAADVLDLEAEAFAEHNVTVERSLLPDCLASGDVEKLKQVVLNLVVNSLDAMPDGGHVRVSVGGDATEVWLAIADNGPGIDPTILAEIFDPFFTTKAAGTGLGLAIVRKLVDQHGGRVLVDSKFTKPSESGEPAPRDPSAARGEGTTVRVVLPRFAVAG
jgi:PAS domain S-box-containing protein